MLDIRIQASVGLAMLVTGATTIMWGGIFLKENVIGVIGSVIAVIGILILTRRQGGYTPKH